MSNIVTKYLIKKLFCTTTLPLSLALFDRGKKKNLKFKLTKFKKYVQRHCYKLNVMCSPCSSSPLPYAEALTPSEMVFGDAAWEVISFRLDHKGEAPLRH